MKTLDEFETSLMNGESVCVGNGFVIVHFYAGMRSDVCGLISACVVTSIAIGNGEYHRSSSVVTAMEAYQVYESISDSCKYTLA